MREIKFRAWDFTENKMMETTELSYGVQYNKNKIEIISQKDCFIFMQYTGLKDKDDIEIYEGDIVNIQGGAFYQGYWEVDEIFEVIYNKTTFMLKNKDYKENFWIAENIYVIGNIYENKELLK